MEARAFNGICWISTPSIVMLPPEISLRRRMAWKAVVREREKKEKKRKGQRGVRQKERKEGKTKKNS